MHWCSILIDRGLTGAVQDLLGTRDLVRLHEPESVLPAPGVDDLLLHSEILGVGRHPTAPGRPTTRTPLRSSSPAMAAKSGGSSPSGISPTRATGTPNASKNPSRAAGWCTNNSRAGSSDAFLNVCGTLGGTATAVPGPPMIVSICPSRS